MKQDQAISLEKEDTSGSCQDIQKLYYPDVLFNYQCCSVKIESILQ
ncbi:unnamed protein product [Paramecium octaurelia]|uniref:Uncharacterized protein n=1 Tax=Paramecium octaurelia TaxID=43137 RepID=A0A8S1W4R4_PAROT|nr:unnamed protein product [Paramecium octaurelia]